MAPSVAEPRIEGAESRANKLDLNADFAAALAPHGLLLRGGFHPEPGEEGLEGAGTVLLVGNAGPAMWEAFAPHIDGAPDPLNRWTRRVVESIAEAFGVRALYPFGEPNWPFQRWAQRGEPVFPSPLGMLIHPQYGLWHAYRAALLLPERLVLPEKPVVASPCETCATRPCLRACPVGAFRAGYDVESCASHLRHLASRNGVGAGCRSAGCHARSACSVGVRWRYPDAQIGFHMAAYARAVGG